MPVPELHIDVLIFGGGIAGLWTLARLRKEGYSCLLLESNALGAGQTIASQGIIHGGVKYALGGEADASNALAGMPGRWRDALEGRGPVELPSAAILSEHQYLWTTPGLASRVAGLGATALLRSGVERVPPAQRPEIFQGAKGIDVYRTAEPVLDPRVVIEALAGHAPGCLRRYAGADQVQFELPEGPGWVRTAIVDHVSQKPLLHILPRFVVLAAGAGNAMLQGRLGVSPGVFVQQLRPLHMVMARGLPAPLFGHCLGMSAVPRLTVTSARMGDEWVWWIGGALAEAEGVARKESDQIAAARHELAICLPWLDLGKARFATLRVDRAECVRRLEHPPRRPDGPMAIVDGNLATVWPTKLAFAPLVADQVFEGVQEFVEKSGADGAVGHGVLDMLEPAQVAPRPWEAAWSQASGTWEDVQWT